MKLFQPIVFLLLWILLFFPASAQLMQGGIPMGLQKTEISSQISFTKVLATNVEQLKQEDQTWDTIAEIPWRFGENIEVNISPAHNGSWQKLADGARLWQTGIYSPGALSINLVFQPYQLPRGAKLFIYTPDRKQILGAFDHRNNQEDGYFATGLVFSDSIIVEYYEPASAAFEGKFTIEQLTHGYRHPGSFADKAFGDSGDCNVNAACDVAEAYGDQIRSVALLLVGSNSFCTGALINNSTNDGTPYILSANHCYRDPSTVVFWFNWESATCDNPDTPPPHQALSGAVQRARYIYNGFSKTGSDFWLMEMNHLPPYEYDLFYSGWNRTEDPLSIDSVVSIHHPRGDIKKFSWSTDSLQVWGYGNTNAGFNTHWRVKSWDAGTTTEGGSSGSPLFDDQGLIIGQLHGGQAACGNTLPDWYGRFSVSWEGGGATTNALKTWLDSQDLNFMHINGYQPVYYLLEATVGENGGGTLDPSFNVMENRSHTFFIEPLPGYFIEDVLVDGISVGAVDSYTFENVTSDHTLLVTFAIQTYTLTATSGENGTITPSGEIIAEHGASQIFTIAPNDGYFIEDVVIDGESTGPVESYTFDNITADHTIHATFAIQTYTLTATAGENGTITPSGEITVEHGASQTFTIASNDGYFIEDIVVDGESTGPVESYTFDNIIADHTLHATFAIQTYTLTATAGGNGTITPSGEIIVEHGTSQTFTFTPDAGYYIEDILVDGESAGPVESYTFDNITADHTIHATFAIQTYTLTATAGENGTITPSGEIIAEHGASQTFTIAPNDGYFIENVVVDGESEGPVESYTFDNITADHTIHATFAIQTYTLTATAGENGTITPSGEIIVEHGASQTFTITPEEGYFIVDVVVDGESVGSAESYTFDNITADHTIHATSAIQTYTLTATTGGNGTITPSGEITVEHGASQTFTFTPDAGYFIEDILVDGESVGPVESYTFENITADHTIHASFAIQTYTLTATAGENGTITPDGEITMEHGASQTFTIAPNDGYFIENVVVDGESTGPVESYTFENITADHSIHTSFAIQTYTLTATAGENGTITPSGEITVEHGASQTFSITPDAGYFIEDILVDGESVGSAESYTFENITADHTIHATFAIQTYTINATSGENGTITPDGEIIVEHGASQAFTLNPLDGYHIDDLLVNGESVGALQSFTFPNVTQNHSIHAIFAINIYQIAFEVEDDKGNAIEDATINLNGTSHEPGHYIFGGIVTGLYPYTVSREGYFSESGEVLVENQDITEKVILQEDDNSIQQVHPGGIIVYPNPATTSVFIESPYPIHQIQLFALSGSKIKEMDVSARVTLFELQDLNTGIYILRVLTREGISSHKIQIIR